MSKKAYIRPSSRSIAYPLKITLLRQPSLQRSCLRCEKKFESVGKQNRVCDNCKGTEDWRMAGAT